MPDAIRSPPGSATTSFRLAELIGCESGVLGNSTLHLFWDLFQFLAKKRIALFVDSESYQIAQWAVRCVANNKTPAYYFSHHNPSELQEKLFHCNLIGRTPVVLTDGFCTGCGRVAPIRDYLKSIRQFGGILVLDDTQALGILGENPSPRIPYGFGGGGSLRYCNVKGPDIIVVNSLAKAFGSPVAVLVGCYEIVKKFKDQSKTQVHCSPPSFTDIHAASNALDINEDRGDTIRKYLRNRVVQFQSNMKRNNFETSHTLFPVQGIANIPRLDIYKVYKTLLRKNIRTILKRSHIETSPQIALLITADHKTTQIDDTISALSNSIRWLLRR